MFVHYKYKSLESVKKYISTEIRRYSENFIFILHNAVMNDDVGIVSFMISNDEIEKEQRLKEINELYRMAIIQNKLNVVHLFHQYGFRLNITTIVCIVKLLVRNNLFVMLNELESYYGDVIKLIKFLLITDKFTEEDADKMKNVMKTINSNIIIDEILTYLVEQKSYKLIVFLLDNNVISIESIIKHKEWKTIIRNESISKYLSGILHNFNLFKKIFHDSKCYIDFFEWYGFNGSEIKNLKFIKYLCRTHYYKYPEIEFMIEKGNIPKITKHITKVSSCNYIREEFSEQFVGIEHLRVMYGLGLASIIERNMINWSFTTISQIFPNKMIFFKKQSGKKIFNVSSNRLILNVYKKYGSPLKKVLL
jgi:hypothetical protein